MNCCNCGHWTAQRKTVYEDGTEVVGYTSPHGKGHCEVLNLEVDQEFGCTKFFAGDHIRISRKQGSPWHHYVMIPCPSCNGRGSFNARHCGQCVGTGSVRRYDDGYVGNNSTLKHPNESPAIDPVYGTIIVSAKSDGALT